MSYIVEPMSAGLATFDYDLDGLIDVYFLNRETMRGTKVTVPPKDRLYRNEGGWRFRDVTDEAGLGGLGFGFSVTVGDFNNDGDPDMYLNNYGPNVLFRNNGDGTFADVTGAGRRGQRRPGRRRNLLPGHGRRRRPGPVRRQLSAVRLQGTRDADHRRRFPGNPSHGISGPVPDSLFRNNGDGTFADVSDESGVSKVSGPRWASSCEDYEQDGDTDIFAVCDVSANQFYRNDGTGKFEEIGILNGTA